MQSAPTTSRTSWSRSVPAAGSAPIAPRTGSATYGLSLNPPAVPPAPPRAAVRRGHLEAGGEAEEALPSSDLHSPTRCAIPSGRRRRGERGGSCCDGGDRLGVKVARPNPPTKSAACDSRGSCEECVGP